MQRKIIVVTAAYGYEHVQAAGGQKALLPVIAKSGADGVEIRRELFTYTDLLALVNWASPLNMPGFRPVIPLPNRYLQKMVILIRNCLCCCRKRRI